MDILFLNTTKKALLKDYLEPALQQQKKTFIVTANPEIVMKTKEDADYKRIVQSADYVIADGIGIVKASSIKKQPLKERIPGFELMVDLLDYADEKGLRCYFLGATEAVSEKMVETVAEHFPHLIIAGHHHGFFDLDDAQVAEKVKQAQPDLIFVALGLPRQEQWIARHLDDFDKGLFMGVGGSFDTLTGEVPRAPKFWINLNLEWFYRLLKQPFRWKRILKVFQFMILIIFKRK